MRIRSGVHLAATVLFVLACSQRVTPEEEFAEAEGGGRPVDVSANMEGTILGPAGEALPPPSVVFVTARSADRPDGRPLAALKLPAGPFPLEFTIGPADAMLPGTSFPDRIVVQARLDRDGDPLTEGANDRTARSEPLPPGARGIKLRLDS